MLLHPTPDNLLFVVTQCSSKLGGTLEVVGIFGETFSVHMDPDGVSNIHFVRVISGPVDLTLTASKTLQEYHAGIVAPVIAKAEPVVFPEPVIVRPAYEVDVPLAEVELVEKEHQDDGQESK